MCSATLYMCQSCRKTCVVKMEHCGPIRRLLGKEEMKPTYSKIHHALIWSPMGECVGLMIEPTIELTRCDMHENSDPVVYSHIAAPLLSRSNRDRVSVQPPLDAPWLPESGPVVEDPTSMRPEDALMPWDEKAREMEIIESIPRLLLDMGASTGTSWAGRPPLRSDMGMADGLTAEERPYSWRASSWTPEKLRKLS